MSKIITFSRYFPAYHPKKGEPTHFVEQIYNAIGLKIGITKSSGNIPEQMWELVNDFVLLDGSAKKHHTIRAGNRFKAGDYFSPRIWSGKPYNSKQIVIAPDIQVKKIWSFRMDEEGLFYLNDKQIDITSSDVPENDGLSSDDFLEWFGGVSQKKNYKSFAGQIICWNDSINY